VRLIVDFPTPTKALTAVPSAPLPSRVDEGPVVTYQVDEEGMVYLPCLKFFCTNPACQAAESRCRSIAPLARRGSVPVDPSSPSVANCQLIAGWWPLHMPKVVFPTCGLIHNGHVSVAAGERLRRGWADVPSGTA
jgi:hypothetical protein